MTTPRSKPSGERLFSWLLLVVALGASALVVRRDKHVAPIAVRQLDIVDAVPAGPELLITADVAALSPALALELLQAGGGSLLGLRELCGFEPILALRRLAFAVPSRGAAQSGTSDFALIAQTSLEPDPVLRCAEAVLRQRGGKPIRSSLGRFTSVRDQAKPVGEVAIRDDGLLVLSGGQYFRDVIDAANGAALGDETARLRAQVHRGIRRRLAPSLLTVTLLPGPSLSVPGVQALGLGLEVTADIKLRGFVGCSSDGCGVARRMLDELKIDLTGDSALSGLKTLNVVEHDGQLDVDARLPREQLAPLLTQLLAP